jgi:hypothetical protein
MKSVIVRCVVAATAIAVLFTSAQAQNAGGGHKGHQQSAAASTPHAPPADDKAYNTALRNMPDKPYDPWHGVR